MYTKVNRVIFGLIAQVTFRVDTMKNRPEVERVSHLFCKLDTCPIIFL